jgi:dTDP-4-dehydrorhamnose reductase
MSHSDAPSGPAPDRVILLVGADGQVGTELGVRLRALGRVVRATRRELDLADADAIRRTVAATRPTMVVNAAAYTAVDAAETDRTCCMRINAVAPGELAWHAAQADASIVHYSTNYVFDGRATHAYREDDTPAPLGVYGASKLEGEAAVAAANPRHLILRTSAVYGWTGVNFMRRMLELAHDREELRVVDDQIVAPTPASSVAQATVRALASMVGGEEDGAYGTYHLTTAGAVSWFEFARAILARDPAREKQRCRRLVPVATTDFPTPARRPANGTLDNAKFAARFGFALPAWQVELARTFAERPAAGTTG